MKSSCLLALGALLVTAPLAAREQVRTSPSIGKVVTTSIGGTVWEEYQYEGFPGVIIEGPVQANWGSLENVNLPAGSALAILREKKLKACQTHTAYNNIGTTVWSDCLFDTDSDGKFDRVSYTSGGMSKVIDPPVSYRRETIEVVGDGLDNFRKVLLYLGSDGGTLKLSYREFANGTARPAFTEDFSIPLADAFPQDIAVKEHVITLHGIDGMGLKFELVR